MLTGNAQGRWNKPLVLCEWCEALVPQSLTRTKRFCKRQCAKSAYWYRVQKPQRTKKEQV